MLAQMAALEVYRSKKIYKVPRNYFNIIAEAYKKEKSVILRLIPFQVGRI
jgi:hypothetical protein